MSHSRIFDEYAKLMSEKGLFKTADKKDTDYNVIPDKAGPDTKVDETGWELTEIAHPDQVQVAESQLNDGIVENGVERQKVMVDVALRNPRGILASLMQTLVKAANVLDADMSEESLKLVKEVDDFLFVLAQQSQVALSPEAGRAVDAHRVARVKALVEEALNRFGDLDWTTFGFGGGKERGAQQEGPSVGFGIGDEYRGLGRGYKETDYAESIVKDATKKLNAFLEARDSIAAAYSLAQYVNQFYKMVSNAIHQSTDWGKDQREASDAWDNLKAETDEWLVRARHDESPKVNPEQAGPGVASKAPASRVTGHRWSVHTPEVGQLQDELGFKGADRDEKFGPKTFAALAEAAKTNSLLDQLMQKMPKTYDGWDNNGIGLALQRIRDGKASAQVVTAPAKPKDELLNPYPEK